MPGAPAPPPGGLPGAAPTNPPAVGPSSARPGARPPNLPRQRWRLWLRLPAVHVPGELPAGAGAWATLLERGGLPLAGEPGRGRVVPAAQLPLGFLGEREILDVMLSVRLSLVDVRERVQAALPASVELVDLHDVWVGAPSVPAALIAADYRVEIAGAPVPQLRVAAEALLGAAELPHERRREKKTQAFDLRPLIVSISVTAVIPPAGAAASDSPSAHLRVRLRHRPDAVGRPEDVIAALGAPPAPPLGGEIRVLGIARERLVLRGDGA